MVGYDIIGDLVSEINITSPRLLAKNVDDFGFDRIAELVENDLQIYLNELIIKKKM